MKDRIGTLDYGNGNETRVTVTRIAKDAMKHVDAVITTGIVRIKDDPIGLLVFYDDTANVWRKWIG